MLELKNIHFRYPNARNDASDIVINNTSFAENQITCILGENGSGKTTILNLIGGHLIPSRGEINLYEQNISLMKAESRPTSTVFQQIGLFPHLTVRENIELAIEPNRLWGKSSETKQKAENLLADFNLAEFDKRKPSQLSIGQQQRVAIARSLSTNPKVLLLDEPTSALDFTNINKLKNTLFAIKEKQTVPIIIVVSHDLPFVLSISDNIKFIEKGKLVFEGTKEDFQSSKWFIH